MASTSPRRDVSLGSYPDFLLGPHVLRKGGGAVPVGTGIAALFQGYIVTLILSCFFRSITDEGVERKEAVAASAVQPQLICGSLKIR
jgi:hypothetical protein